VCPLRARLSENPSEAVLLCRLDDLLNPPELSAKPDHGWGRSPRAARWPGLCVECGDPFADLHQQKGMVFPAGTRQMTRARGGRRRPLSQFEDRFGHFLLVFGGAASGRPVRMVTAGPGLGRTLKARGSFPGSSAVCPRPPEPTGGGQRDLQPRRIKAQRSRSIASLASPSFPAVRRGNQFTIRPGRQYPLHSTPKCALVPPPTCPPCTAKAHIL